MAQRRTRLVLSIPWDDETSDHPSLWGWDVLLEAQLDVRQVHVVDFEEVNERGEPEAV